MSVVKPRLKLLPENVMAVSDTAASTHHHASSRYLMDRTITVEGVVTDFRLVNPHVRIYFEVTNKDGEVEQWLAEGQAALIVLPRSPSTTLRAIQSRTTTRS